MKVYRGSEGETIPCRAGPTADLGGKYVQKWLIMGVVLGLVVLALVQVGLGQEKAGGRLGFDPKTRETVQGIVVDAPEVKPKGIPEMLHLTLKTKQIQLTVVLGPNWYMARQGWNITALDRLEVTGFPLQLDGKPAMLAQEIKKGAQVMKFRDQHGKPQWAPSRSQKQ